MPKFHILQDKGEITFNGKKAETIIVLTRHFGFLTCNGCRYFKEAQDLLCETIGQPLHVINSKIAARGRFKPKPFPFFVAI